MVYHNCWYSGRATMFQTSFFIVCTLWKRSHLYKQWRVFDRQYHLVDRVRFADCFRSCHQWDFTLYHDHWYSFRKAILQTSTPSVDAIWGRNRLNSH